MPRRRTLTALVLATLVLLPVAACGGGTGGVEEASDYLFSCPLQVTNGTARELVAFQWILVERLGSGDVVWGTLARNPSAIWSPGLQQDVILGPNYADVSDPSNLEWEVVFVDDTDTTYGPWTIPLADCGGTSFVVTPADAN